MVKTQLGAAILRLPWRRDAPPSSRALARREGWPGGRVVADAGEDIGEPGLGIDVVQLRGDDQAVQERRALTPVVRTRERPRLASKGQAAQRSLGSIVGKTDSAVVEEAGEGRAALEHVVNHAGDLVMARQLAPFLAHPRFQRDNQRCALRLVDGEPLLSRQSIDAALDAPASH